MQLEMLKMAGGMLVPLDDMQAEALMKFKTGEQYQVEIKQVRNPAFHRKVFAFFKFCFDHWAADKTEWRYFDERTQFEAFRKDLTILAGFKDVCWSINAKEGKPVEARFVAKSLSYGNMEQDEFERCYSALINAAMQNIFKGCNDERILDRLYAFFY
ncbi:DUF1367 family protein [Haemophilus paraphrohaemolyticus]|uniref:PF07105 domain protein n=1 Tax=Haemophilus paraphrohaemolyticus HK411 TaxID=1095743 RepID=I2NMH2_9PAST|nr:DUF1367 family protein [Haemophilus paraphrohaemolyticus]EIG27033.1 PF07105 domain protein [Haemophilus paraphrohaemolyticus HK411]OOR93254.1 hypothetical protein B0184_09985 [Haemophilus paraphrohaemolyticus]STP02063.1 Protein of uncharacterised function (DUF1367) [Haemophilus paraphrohaemolyticus]DAX94379.1 MAG TPA: Protein of unknown function (DUF1367) [Bacteriophage sp.]